MAAIRWNFPNGTNGDMLTPALAGADTFNFSGGAATLSNTYVLSGVSSLSARFSLDLAGHLWIAKEGLSATSYAYDFYVYTPADIGGRVNFAWAGVNSSNRSLSVHTGGSSRRVELWDSGGSRWAGTASLPNNAWIRVSVFGTCGVGTGTGRIAWYLGNDTVPQEDSGLLTGLDTQAFIDRIRIGGKAASSTITGGVVYIGSWAYDTQATGLIEPMRNWASRAPQRRDGAGWSALTMRKRESGVWQPNNTSFK